MQTTCGFVDGGAHYFTWWSECRGCDSAPSTSLRTYV